MAWSPYLLTASKAPAYLADTRDPGQCEGGRMHRPSRTRDSPSIGRQISRTGMRRKAIFNPADVLTISRCESGLLGPGRAIALRGYFRITGHHFAGTRSLRGRSRHKLQAGRATLFRQRLVLILQRGTHGRIGCGRRRSGDKHQGHCGRSECGSTPFQKDTARFLIIVLFHLELNKNY